MSKKKSTLHSNSGVFDNIKMSRSISSEDIWTKFHKDVIGIDVETMSAASHKGEIFNVGLSHPSGGVFEVNILQNKGFSPSSLQHFHQQKNRMGPYLAGEIPGVPALSLTKRKKWKQISDETGLKYKRSVMAKGEAHAYLNRTLKNTPYNVVGHNLNFERRKFKEWGLPGIVDGSAEYHDLIFKNAMERRSEVAAFKSGEKSASAIRKADVARQMKVYELQIKEGLVGGAKIDSQEIAKSLFAISREKGLISSKAALALGSNVEFLTETLLSDLSEVHRGVQDVSLQNRLLPQMIEYVEEIKGGGVPKGLGKWLQRWKDPESIKIHSTTKAIEQGIENLHGKSSHTMFSGRVMVSSYSEMKDALSKTGDYTPSIITQGDRITEYKIKAEEIFKQAEVGLSDYHKGLLKGLHEEKIEAKIEQKAATLARRLPKGLGAAILGAGALAIGGYLYNRTTKISGKDDDYNFIEGLRHDSSTAVRRKKYTDFGSGYTSIRHFESKMRDPIFAEAIERDKKNKQRKSLLEMGEFTKAELMKLDGDEVLEGINRKRKQLREVRLNEYNIIVDDADTVLLRRKDKTGKDITIRMGGIDTPETTHGDDPMQGLRWKQAQPYGERSTERLKEILGSTDKVRLIIDPTQRTYGRYIGILMGENGLFSKSNTNINLQLVREGYASSLEFGSAHRDAAERSTFMAAGSKAEREGLGMWGDDFFKDWKSFSTGAGRDSTFNSFTDILRLSKNRHLAQAARLMWEDGESAKESYRSGFLYKASNQFSGKDGQYNTIEALPHGWFGRQRKNTTSFGSGYQGPVTKDDYRDPTPFQFGAAIGAIGVSAGIYHLWDKEASFFGRKIALDNLSYMGSPSSILGRTNATFGDLGYNAIRRMELGLGGLPKAFSISTLLSPYAYSSATIDIDLFNSTGKAAGKYSRAGYASGTTFGYEKYLMELTGKSKAELSNYSGVRFTDGKLYGLVDGKTTDVLLEHASIVKRIHDPKVTKSVSQLAKSYESTLLSGGIGKEHEFLVVGGQTKLQARGRMAHAYAHETFSKYLRLMNDPVKAIKDLIPSADSKILRGAERIMKYVPSMGVAGGERGLVGTLPQLIGRHFKKAAPWLVGLPVAFGLVNSAIKMISPEDTVGDKAGIYGLGAEAIRLAHMGYAHASERLGLTQIYKDAEAKTPGLVGLKPWLGFTASGMITGTAAGMMAGVAKEAMAKGGAERYASMINSKTAKEGLGLLGKVPGFGGEYTRSIRWGIKGAVASGLLAIPFLLQGLGSSKSVEELDDEYLGGKEVAVRKARWWEFGTTPWSGGKIQYYRPDWYNRTLSNYKDESLYDGEDISPIGKAVRTLIDPYWLEKKHYEDRPYPVAGPNGDGYGIFGPLYEMTLGRVIKPPKFMHIEEWGEGKRSTGFSGARAPELGETEKQYAVSPYDLSQQARSQYYRAYEALGLRGFIASAVKETVTGEQNLDQYTPVLQSSADMDSIRRDFWDKNLGGLGGVTEPYRRLNPKRPYTDEYVNPIKNKMPSWLPGRNYFINFKTGDPFTKIAEGEYRLPGQGYATRYEELKGLDPEKYPLIHQYKILADVAPYSSELRSVRKKLESFTPTETEREIFLETERQLTEKRKKKEFRPDVYSESAMGRYGAALVDMYRANPLEHLTPISPAHKFLPPTTAVEKYEESVYGKDFKLWQRPFDDFIKPAINLALNNIGLDTVPSEVKERRTIEEYFDQLKYVKFRRLEDSAISAGETAKAEAYHKKSQKTMTGMDPYQNLSKTLALIPKREKAFFSEFLEAEGEKREKIRKLLSPRMRDFYEAQWDKKLLHQLDHTDTDLTQIEREKGEEAIFNRMAKRRSQQLAKAKNVESMENLPDEGWVGWRANVDLEDVKLKYLMTTARDYHSYDLWDERVKGLGRKPFIADAAEAVDPFGDGAEPASYGEVYEQAVRMGISNPELFLKEGGGSISYDLEYDRTEEIHGQLKEMDMVI